MEKREGIRKAIHSCPSRCCKLYFFSRIAAENNNIIRMRYECMKQKQIEEFLLPIQLTYICGGIYPYFNPFSTRQA